MKIYDFRFQATPSGIYLPSNFCTHQLAGEGKDRQAGRQKKKRIFQVVEENGGS